MTKQTQAIILSAEECIKTQRAVIDAQNEILSLFVSGDTLAAMTLYKSFVHQSEKEAN